MSNPVLCAVGSYSRSGSGRGPGIELLRIDIGARTDEPAAELPVERLAAVDLPDPSFVLWSEDGTILYAVLETDPSRLVALRVDEDGSSAEVAADLELDEAGACHLAPGRRRGTLVVSNFGSGAVEVVRLDDDRLPAEVIDVEDHRDHADGRSPHPHQVVRLPGTDLLAVPDLGLDRVFLYGQDLIGNIGLAGQIPLSRSSGPRHLAADHEAGQLHISCELSGMVATATRQSSPSGTAAPRALRGATHRWSVTSMVPASTRSGSNALSHIELTDDEGILLVANRGPDTLSALSLASMRPRIVSEIEVGEHPRHFMRLGDLVLVAAQESDRIDVLRLRGEELAPAAAPIPAPSVSCLAARP